MGSVGRVLDTLNVDCRGLSSAQLDRLVAHRRDDSHDDDNNTQYIIVMMMIIIQVLAEYKNK